MQGKIESHHFPDVGFDSTVIRLGLMAADVFGKLRPLVCRHCRCLGLRHGILWFDVSGK